MKGTCVSKMVVIVSLFVFLGGGAAYASGKKPLLLRYAAMSSPKGVRSAAVKWWASEIEKRSRGAVKFKFFWSKALLKPKAVIPMHYATFPVLIKTPDEFVRLVGERAPEVRVLTLKPGEAYEE